MGKISRSPRYVVDMTGTNLLCLEELRRGGRVNSEKI